MVTDVKILIAGALLTFLSGCTKKGCDIDYGYVFETPFTLSPALDTFKVGDTIHVAADFPHSVYDRTTSQTYLLEDFNFGPATLIYKADTVYPPESLIDGMSSFTVIVPAQYDYSKFIFSDGRSTYIGSFKYVEGRYKLDFKLVAKKPGFYVLNQGSSLTNSYGFDPDFPGKCRNESVREIISPMNNNRGTNIELLKNSPEPYWNERTLEKPQERFYDKGSYAFYVVE